MNVLTVSGNIGRDAETRQAGGSTVASFSLAMKSGYGDKAQTIWLDCSLWGKQAESGLVQYLKKGQFVVVTGEMGTREHEGKTYITLRVNGVTLGGKQEAPQQAQQPTPAQHRQQQHAPQRPANQPPAGYQGVMPQQAAPDFDDPFGDSIPF
jgi:single-strand DNA-binding protein